MTLTDDSISIVNEIGRDAGEDHDAAWEEEHMTFWTYWREANGTAGPRTGPFATQQEAARYVQDTVRGFAAALEHGTGAAGEWTPDGKLYRGDLDIELGRFIIEELDGADVPD